VVPGSILEIRLSSISHCFFTLRRDYRLTLRCQSAIDTYHHPLLYVHRSHNILVGNIDGTWVRTLVSMFLNDIFVPLIGLIKGERELLGLRYLY